MAKDYTIEAQVEIPEGGAEGMIVTEGGRFGGYGLFLSKGDLGFGRGHVVFLYNLLDLKRTMWEGPELKPGKHTIRFDFKYAGPGFGKGGTGELFVDGKSVAKKTMENSTPIEFPEDEDFDVGLDTRTGVAMIEYRYDCPFKFTGKIDKLRFDLGPAQYTAEDRKQTARNCGQSCASEGLDGVTNAMKKLLALAAVLEGVTGLALIVAPSLVGRLLLGAEVTGVAIPVARVLGIALIALGVACWPGPALLGMLTYGGLVTAYLPVSRLRRRMGLDLSLAGCVLHAMLTLLSRCALVRRERTNQFLTDRWSDRATSVVAAKVPYAPHQVALDKYRGFSNESDDSLAHPLNAYGTFRQIPLVVEWQNRLNCRGEHLSCSLDRVRLPRGSRVGRENSS